ncbi:MAG: ATP-binding cassette domain-containing protein, partial [Desulfobacterales bacterium]
MFVSRFDPVLFGGEIFFNNFGNLKNRFGFPVSVNGNFMALLSIKNVKMGFGGPLLLDDVSLQIESGERICLMGRNGEGKSTLLRVISKDMTPDSGEIIWQQGIRVALLPQEVPRETQGRVLDVICGSELAQSAETQGEIRLQAESILSRMKLDPDAAFGELSAGLRRRV